MIARNGERFQLMLFFLPIGHVLTMLGIQEGVPSLFILRLLYMSW